MAASFLNKICTPSLVYLAISVISILLAVYYGFGVYCILAKILMVLVWAWFLNYLCTKNLVGLSWFLVVLPYIVLIVSVLTTMDAVEMTNFAQSQIEDELYEDELYDSEYNTLDSLAL